MNFSYINGAEDIMDPYTNCLEVRNNINIIIVIIILGLFLVMCTMTVIFITCLYDYKARRSYVLTHSSNGMELI